ncbi:30S ribosomal protein S12 methylthiotransferase RimO [Oleidesulfovibrio sp.]|uniref:30S ribosomal protein S12 methylthiotransferase RimO n=1 Tax=Oleidesulfovibrio sp. TaxID=2909707 RepID=UPI003A897C78
MISVYSISLGCPKNRVDTEWLLGVLGPDVTPVEEMEDADLVLINTCGFIGPAVEESVQVIVQAIADLEDVKDRPLLAVAGCLVGRYGRAELAAELPEVDLWLTNRDMGDWPEMIGRALGVAVHVPPVRLLSTGPSYAYLKVSDGCGHNCSFCTIPSIRGGLVSTPAEVLEAEARNLLSCGVKELIFVAQDVAAYGKDLGMKHGLRSLLDRLLPLDGLERLRLMYLYPAGLNKELLTYLKDAGKPFVPYFDIPMQHAHPDVLSRMGRPFARNPREVVDRVREVFPDAALRTSIITGFPGETQEHYDHLTRFVQEVRFMHLGVFAYRAEEGTPAADMPDQVDEVEKDWRRDALMEVQADISEEILEGFTGEQMDVLVDAPHDEWPGLHVGRTWFQAPDIDGVTYISGPGVAPGAMVDAEIVEARTYDLVALS